MTDEQSSHPQTSVPAARGRRWPLVAIVALAAALTGAVATHAFSEGGFGRGFGHGPWGGGPGFMGRFDPARAEDRADRMVRHLVIEIDASPQQQEQLRAIVKAAVRELVPMREQAETARTRVAALLTQPNVDRAAIEAFRAEQLALADAASRRIVQALADAAEVLTPEQRRRIEEHLRARRAFWRGWHRG